MCQQKLLTHVHKNGIMNTSSREKEKSDGTRNQISEFSGINEQRKNIKCGPLN